MPTVFNTTAAHADVTLIRKFCLREDFIFYLIKGLKLFTNEAKNQEHCSNNYVVSEYLSRMKAMTYKKNYEKTYCEKNLDYQLGTVGLAMIVLSIFMPIILPWTKAKTQTLTYEQLIPTVPLNTKPFYAIVTTPKLAGTELIF